MILASAIHKHTLFTVEQIENVYGEKEFMLIRRDRHVEGSKWGNWVEYEDLEYSICNGECYQTRITPELANEIKNANLFTRINKRESLLITIGFEHNQYCGLKQISDDFWMLNVPEGGFNYE